MLSIYLSIMLWTTASVQVTVVAYDAETHQAVRGTAIIQNAEGEQNIGFGESIKTTGGEMIVGAVAEGYLPSISSFSPEGDLKIAFYLQPKTPPVETTQAWIDARRTPRGSLAMGFLTDDATGAPVSGALITSGGHRTRSDENGFFWYIAPLGQGWSSVRIEHPNYATLTRTGIPVWPGGDWTMRIRLRPGQGEMFERDPHGLDEPKGDMACDPPVQDEKRLDDDAGIQVASVGFPLNIRVGRNCPTSRTCASVEVHPMENYVKRVLASEWYSCWFDPSTPVVWCGGSERHAHHART